ncbi:MAG: InlB B-repeat-containing protein, partial [Clostridia bacterium]|nr:InlB B-repeat-containing protein [Clostridia bacterium]
MENKNKEKKKMNTKTIKKMRFGLTVIAMLCLTAGITLMGNIGTTAKADASPLGDTKYNVSTNGEHMLLVTPITDVTDVYEAGYEFTGETPTLEKHATNKYYTSISAGGDTWTAKSLFGGDYTTATPMIVWEVTRDAAKTYSYKAYYKKGTRIDEVLYAKDSDEPQYNAVTTTPLFFTVTFDTDGGSAIASKYLPDGTAASTFADVSTTKAGYTFSKWQVSGEDYNFATATVTADVTLDAVWTANTYYATF